MKITSIQIERIKFNKGNNKSSILKKNLAELPNSTGTNSKNVANC